MRRADRLFQIVQLLRRERAVTAATLARELAVSERTIYRDVQDLVLSGVPIQGEAGVGYALPTHFDLPPLMFDREEVQALALGARMVQSSTDERLARAARSALAKVEQVLPPKLASASERSRLLAPLPLVPKESLAVMATLRAALDERRVLRLEYADEAGRPSGRDVRPLALSFWGRAWTLTAWCELRDDFRNFRLDRIAEARPLARTFVDEPGRTFEDFLARVASADASSPAREDAARPGRADSTGGGAPAANDGTRAVLERATKPPRLDLSAAERRAFGRAGLKVAELAALEAAELARRTRGAIELARCGELVALARFQALGSVGLETARDFVALGFTRVAELSGHDPRELYARMCALTHSRQDPCVEDVFRCAVAQSERPDLPARWREWHRWTPLRGAPPGTLPPELAAFPAAPRALATTPPKRALRAHRERGRSRSG